ncbi:MAG: 5'-nucleotidase, partial [Oligoflexia bacterium]|nr:5'-nucleotidase [Oligoflexia bacterium]
FDLVVTSSEKPRFFTELRRFLRVDPDTGLMSNWDRQLEPGIYQGGNAQQLTGYYKVNGDQILYLGDHIFGDILTLKKSCNWRTGLVIEELNEEVDSLQQGRPRLNEIDELMKKKEALELIFFKNDSDPEAGKKVYSEIKTIDNEISRLITEYQGLFNTYWGPIMRSGQEESRLSQQIQKYACIYMGNIGNFRDYSPRHYFRPRRRLLPHEIND